MGPLIGGVSRILFKNEYHGGLYIILDAAAAASNALNSLQQLLQFSVLKPSCASAPHYSQSSRLLDPLLL
jgi:hypothetical protein